MQEMPDSVLQAADPATAWLRRGDSEEMNGV